jgi:putative transposase
VSRYRLIDQEKMELGLCRVRHQAQCGYYAWVARGQAGPSVWCTAQERDLARIRQVHADSRGTYGYRRVHAELRGRILP